MHKNYRVYLSHMLDCIHRIDDYVMNKDHFFSSRLVQDAVVRNLQVMAESSQRIPDEIKQQYPEIPWRKLSGFRNILVHDYLGLDLDVVWSVVDIELSELESTVSDILAKFGSQD